MVASARHGTRFVVEGGVPLRGVVEVSGAKNAALAEMCASLLTGDDLVLSNVPDILDTRNLAELLRALGACVESGDGSVRINAAKVDTFRTPADLVATNRASFQVMGPLLARFGYAAAPPPGGDFIGQRPVDVHIKGFEALGANVYREGEFHIAEAPGGPGSLTGARIFMDYPSVSGTQNVMMAAVLARGHSTIVNAATEPEVQQLSRVLNEMGANVTGIGTQVLEIEGVERLGGASVEVMPDRIEAGTFAMAAAITRGSVEIVGAQVSVMDAPLAKLAEAGAVIQPTKRGVKVSRKAPLTAVNFQALPFPGLATDLQAPMAAVLTQADGVSTVDERVFDNRLLYVNELRKMGATIVSTGNTAIVTGPSKLHGAQVYALDVRGGAAVLLAGLVAQGTTIIEDIYHLDRGYERLGEKFKALGARIERE